jgi:hypothetical protein
VSITQHYTPERTKSTGVQTPPRPSPHRPPSVLDKRSRMCKLLVWQYPIKSLHSRTHTTSSNEGLRPHGAFLWVRGVRRWGRSAGSRGRRRFIQEQGGV